ncbi:MAG: hypothetical protein V4596_14225 [Bdellovibrionota bacterium]
MSKLFVILVAIYLVGCTTTQIKEPKAKWKVLNNSNPTEVSPHSNFVPSGTELIFTSAKHFTEKDNQINIELSPVKRCSLSTTFDKTKFSDLTSNTVLTVVGYRGETSELVLSESSYHQYFLSCVSKEEQKRKTSSVKKKMVAKNEWKKSVVEIDDIQKMSPLLKVKFIPQN